MARPCVGGAAETAPCPVPAGAVGSQPSEPGLPCAGCAGAAQHLWGASQPALGAAGCPACPRGQTRLRPGPPLGPHCPARGRGVAQGSLLGGSTAPRPAPRAGTEPSCVSVVLLGPVRGVKPGEIKSIAWKHFSRLPSCPAGEPGCARGGCGGGQGMLLVASPPCAPTTPQSPSGPAPTPQPVAVQPPAAPPCPREGAAPAAPFLSPAGGVGHTAGLVGLQPRACQ